MSTEAKIEHVSDTAIWVAALRAQESERPDAIFRDRLASALVGERGQLLARSMPYRRFLSWIMVVRTSAIDHLIMQALAEGVDCVLNLGAGLDTRPYRLKLPAQLRWVEVDFPQIIDHKNEKLASETPACRLERYSVDLSDAAAAQALFIKIGSASKRVLVLTEGVIAYLSNPDAASLADSLFEMPNFHYWIQDYRNGGYAKSLPWGWENYLKAAPLLFNAENWLSFFVKHGWQAKEIKTAADEGVRIGRKHPFLLPWSLYTWLLPRRQRDKIRKATGYVLMERIQTELAH